MEFMLLTTISTCKFSIIPGRPLPAGEVLEPATDYFTCQLESLPIQQGQYLSRTSSTTGFRSLIQWEVFSTSGERALTGISRGPNHSLWELRLIKPVTSTSRTLRTTALISFHRPG